MGWKLVKRFNTLAYLEKEKAAKEEAEKLIAAPESEILNSGDKQEESLLSQEEMAPEETETVEEPKAEQPEQKETVEVVKEKKTTKKSTKKKKAS